MTRRMVGFATLVLALVVLVPACKSASSGSHSNAGLNAAPGNFDFYLLNLWWAPEFCLHYPKLVECAGKPGFILHGLWPQNDDRTYPKLCSKEPGLADSKPYLDILPDLPLLDHEWKAHGTCSGLSPKNYFDLIREAFSRVVIPSDLREVGNELELRQEALIAKFAESNPGFPPSSFDLVCTAEQKLTAIEICLTKDIRPRDCPAAPPCKSHSVKLTPTANH